MIALVAAALLVQAAPAPSAVPPAPAAAPSTPVTVASPGADKVICKSLPQTGSLFAGPKECHRKSEWDAINADSRDNVNSYQQRVHQGSGPG